ncbi:uncharacterized protein VTP21DRAFT_7012 [Calcarisporiella thermophila]|uniref:uncharacterized protein n=1 Tax=Calcarisporiella thermophila TaxID=911321 RepID=UPI0037444046
MSTASPPSNEKSATSPTTTNAPRFAHSFSTYIGNPPIITPPSPTRHPPSPSSSPPAPLSPARIHAPLPPIPKFRNALPAFIFIQVVPPQNLFRRFLLIRVDNHLINITPIPPHKESACLAYFRGNMTQETELDNRRGRRVRYDEVELIVNDMDEESQVFETVDHVSIEQITDEDGELVQLTDRQGDVLLLQPRSREEKREFVNLIRFFGEMATKKNALVETPLRWPNRSRSRSPARPTTEELQHYEEEGDISDLIDHLLERCTYHEEHIASLQKEIEEKARTMDSYIQKLVDLDDHIKALNENVSLARNSRETAETMRQSMNTAHQLLDRLASTQRRIREKSNVLNRSEALLDALQSQVELQQQSQNFFRQETVYFILVVLGIIIAIAIHFLARLFE